MPFTRSARQVASLALIVGVLAGPLAGCLSPGEPGESKIPLVQPTGGDFAVPGRATPSPATAEEATAKSPTPDPRLNVTAKWARNDWWYYESNHSRAMRVHVAGVVGYGGEGFIRLVTEYSLIGHDPHLVVTSLVTKDFRTVNTTTPTGRSDFDPPHPGLRFLPGDATYTYNETGYSVSGDGAFTWKNRYAVRVTEAWALYPMRLPAGNVTAAHFRIATEKIDQAGKRTFVFSERWWSPDVLNDVQIVLGARTDDEERFQLVAYQRAGVRHGIKADYMKF